MEASPSGEYLAISLYNTVHIWHMTRQILLVEKVIPKFDRIVFSTTSNHVLAYQTDGSIQVHHLDVEGTVSLVLQLSD